jgi:hypothetical protein
VTTIKRTTTLLVLAACLVAAGCGSDDEGKPIPATIADQLQTRLNEIERRFDFGNGACGDIENDSRPAVDQLIASIPDNVDADVRQGLRDGFDRLFALSEEQCDQAEQTDTETDTEPAPTPEPEPEPTATVTAPPETETVPPPETQPETTPPETEEQVPPDQGGDESGGGQGGGGNGEGQSGSGGNGESGIGGSGGGTVVPEGQE